MSSWQETRASPGDNHQIATDSDRHLHIRVHSDGERSLDDLMREMVERGAGGWKMSTEKTLQIIAAEASDEFAEVVRGIVVDGDLPVLDPETFAPCLKLEMAQLPGFDIGFDVETSFDARLIQGVRMDGPAFVAGLRDGDVLHGGSYQLALPLPHKRP